ncbi:MAG: TonB-dependent receptor, partial [Chlorobi bacterium]|nr:TonB-dependent receptor [Chlorobiota bacterium]
TYIPSSRLEVNSRGETQVFLRGASERQLLVFLDGTLLNIPWDNRADLSLIPAEAVAHITTSAGLASVLYGPNSLGGVVNIVTREYVGEPGSFSSRLLFGDNGTFEATGYGGAPAGNWHFMAGAGYRRTDGFSLPSAFDLRLNGGDNLRRGTQRELADALLRAGYLFPSGDEVTLALRFIDGTQGVAPEIGSEKPRFWNIPLSRREILTVQMKNHLGNGTGTVLESSLSFDFSQTRIEQFDDSTYSNLDDAETGTDRTVSGRMLLKALAGERSLLRAGLSGFLSEHVESFFSSPGIENTYTQYLLSLGAEYEYHPGDSWVLLAGGSVDASGYPSTGDKPSVNATANGSFTAGFVWSATERLSIRGTVGRKTRFPSMRERFSGALGKFAPNPELKPENAVVSEVGMHFTAGMLDFDVAGFGTFLRDGITRITLSDGRFQRVNLDRILRAGIETRFAITPAPGFRFSGWFTYLHARGENPETRTFSDTLEYEPSLSAFLVGAWDVTKRVQFLVEMDYQSRQYGLLAGVSRFIPVEQRIVFNARLSAQVGSLAGVPVSAFFRVNNIFDQVMYYKAGLPGPGRTVRAGIRMLFH